MRSDHEDCVDAWFARLVEHAPEARVRQLDRALGHLWRRCHVRLGQVTLMAIADRALHEVRAKYPCIRTALVGPDGFTLDGLKAQAPKVSIEELNEASRLLLVEFLRIVGHLTAEVLTPALHAQLLESAAAGEGWAPSRGDGAEARP